MNIYENVATEAIASFFSKEPVWKKEVLFNFLLEPFHMELKDIKDVITQDNLKGTIPDFSIITSDRKEIRFEVKINNTGLTDSEKQENTRDAFLIRKQYQHINEVPGTAKILYWEDLFEKIDNMGATKDFARLDLVRDYMHEDIHTLLLSPHEVAMFYSPKTVAAVYEMSWKILDLCKDFLDTHTGIYEYKESKDNPQLDFNGVGYYFTEKKGKKRLFFLGLCPNLKNEDYYFSICLNSPSPDIEAGYKDDEWAYFPLDKEILAACDSDEELQERFNKNVEEVLKSIK